MTSHFDIIRLRGRLYYQYQDAFGHLILVKVAELIQNEIDFLEKGLKICFCTWAVMSHTSGEPEWAHSQTWFWPFNYTWQSYTPPSYTPIILDGTQCSVLNNDSNAIPKIPQRNSKHDWKKKSIFLSPCSWRSWSERRLSCKQWCRVTAWERAENSLLCPHRVYWT